MYMYTVFILHTEVCKYVHNEVDDWMKTIGPTKTVNNNNTRNIIRSLML